MLRAKMALALVVLAFAFSTPVGAHWRSVLILRLPPRNPKAEIAK